MNDETLAQRPLRILHLEDSPRDAEIIREHLIDAGFYLEIDWVTTGQEYTAFLRRGGYDIVLADYLIPGFDALEALVQAKTYCPGVPFISISGTIGEERAIELLKQDATDYVLKNRLARLPLAMERALEEVRERQARLQAEAALRKSEELHRLVLNNIADAVFITDAAGAFQYVCPNVDIIFGYSQQEVQKMAGVSDLLGEDIFPPSEFETLRELKNIEWDITDKNGKIHTLLVNVKQVSIDVGTRLYTCRDISQRKEVERNLVLMNFALNNVHEAAFLTDENARFEYVNEEACRVLGYSREVLLGLNIMDIDPDCPLERWYDHWRELQENGSITLEEWHRAKDGHLFPVEISANYFEFNGRGYNLALVRDITERKQAEVELLRLNRELRAISDCNQALMRAEDEQSLIDTVCRIICDEADYRMAWVGYAENDDAKTVRPVAWAGVEEGYLGEVAITWADTERGHGPSGIAIRKGQTDCIRDFATEPKAAPWRESALQRGYRSSIALPLKDESANTFGILTIYSTEPNTFTTDEVRLLEELAGDLAFGITALRTRIKRQQAEEKLQQRLNELQQWYNATLNREGRVQELKREVNELLKRQGEPPRYESQT